MSDFIYKCPGTYRQKDIMYSYKAKVMPIPEGWFDNLSDAVDDAGEKAIYTKYKKKSKGVNKYAKGLPSTFPVEIEPDVIEVIQEDNEDTLLDQFKLKPELLTKIQHIELAKSFGLKLMMNYKEETMIKKIKEVI
tara:strand:- start:317 stop:721 length:405 start_codon:yes stop_codon:yes gene_type:complete